MKRSVVPMREGFWWSRYSPLLPKPIANDKAWKGKKVFLEALRNKQAKSQKAHYKGSSECRICECRNGSTEYKADGWVWPEGLEHYIKEHNVRPSLAFQEFVIGHEVGR